MAQENVTAVKPLVTFMIATRNRVDELVKTLDSCLRQDWPSKEILVVDDASSDGTYRTVTERFPEVEIVRFDKNRGSIAARNNILRRAKGDYIIALDDDSRFVEPNSCRRIVERMESETDLGILSFQVIGPEFPERTNDAGRLRGEWHCSSFADCGAAIRRAMFVQTGMFPEFFFHMYEEPDLAIRAWDAGFRVLQWNDVVVYHEFSVLNRNEQRTHRRHARNEACSVVMRFPWHLVLPATVARLAGQFRYAWRRGWVWREPRVWLETLLFLPQALRYRKPVRSRAVKIAVAVNRARTADPKAVWHLGSQSWWRILFGANLLDKEDDLVPEEHAVHKSL
jgi:GT2 family glycosyltransferase